MFLFAEKFTCPIYVYLLDRHLFYTHIYMYIYNNGRKQNGLTSLKIIVGVCFRFYSILCVAGNFKFPIFLSSLFVDIPFPESHWLESHATA